MIQQMGMRSGSSSAGAGSARFHLRRSRGGRLGHPRVATPSASEGWSGSGREERGAPEVRLASGEACGPHALPGGRAALPEQTDFLSSAKAREFIKHERSGCLTGWRERSFHTPANTSDSTSRFVPAKAPSRLWGVSPRERAPVSQLAGPVGAGGGRWGLGSLSFLLSDLVSEQKVRDERNSRLTQEKLREEPGVSGVRCANTVSSCRRRPGRTEGGSGLFKQRLMRPTALSSGAVVSRRRLALIPACSLKVTEGNGKSGFSRQTSHLLPLCR